jgi:putative flippase GtrA
MGRAMIDHKRADQLRHLFAFGVAGGTGFVIDASILHLLIAVGWNPLVARIVAIAIAMVFGWLINRTWTFPVPGRPRFREFLRYAGVAWLSLSINYAVFAGMLLAWPQIWPIEALLGGTFVGMFFSYFGYRFVAFGGVNRSKA